MKNRARRIIAIFLSVTFISIFLCSCSGNVASSVASIPIDTKTEETISIPSSVSSAVSSETSSSEIDSSVITSSETVSSQSASSSSNSSENFSDETSSSAVSSKENYDDTTTDSKDSLVIPAPRYSKNIPCPVGEYCDITPAYAKGWVLEDYTVSLEDYTSYIVDGTNTIKFKPFTTSNYVVTSTFVYPSTGQTEKCSVNILVESKIDLSDFYGPNVDTGF